MAKNYIKTTYTDGSVVLSNIANKRQLPFFAENELITYTKVTKWYDNTDMSDAKVDGIIYVKNIESGDYWKLNIPNSEQSFLEIDTISDLRNLSDINILLLKMRYYKGVRLTGYYFKGDTPKAIEYLVSETISDDDGGSVFAVGDIKLEHIFSEFVNLKYYGTQNAATDFECFQNACLKYNKIEIPADGITIAEPLSISPLDNFELRGLGKIFLINGGHLHFTKAVEAIPRLSGDLTTSSATVVFDDTHGLTVGDVFGIQNQNDYSGGDRYYFNDGQLFRVIKVLNNTTVLTSAPPKRTFELETGEVDFPYLSSFKLSGKGIVLSDLHIVPDHVVEDNSPVLLSVEGFVGVKVNNITIQNGGSNTALEISKCYSFDVSNIACEIHSGDSYPISVSNSQKGTIYPGTQLYSGRHCIAMGGYSGLGCVPCADIEIVEGVSENDVSRGFGALDNHQNTEDIIYSNVKSNAINISGRNVILKNAVIKGWTDDFNTQGRAIDCNDLLGGTVTIENTEIITAGTGINGYLYFDVSKLREDLTINILNLRITHTGSDANLNAARLIFLDMQDMEELEYKITINIDGISVNKTTVKPFSIASLYGEATVGNNVTFNVKNSNIASGCPVVLANETNLNTIKVTGQINKSGARSNDDATITLFGGDTVNQIFDTPFTSSRYVYLPNPNECCEGEYFVISKLDAVENGWFLGMSVTDGVVWLADNEWAKVQKVGSYGEGTWMVVQKGSVV